MDSINAILQLPSDIYSSDIVRAHSPDPGQSSNSVSSTFPTSLSGLFAPLHTSNPEVLELQGMGTCVCTDPGARVKAVHPEQQTWQAFILKAWITPTK